MTATRLRRIRFAPVAALCWLGLMFALLPAPALANAHVTLGSLVTVGASEPTLARAAPGFDAPAVEEIPPGSTVTVLDGPIVSLDGTSWYLIDGRGYLPGNALSGASSGGVTEPLPAGAEARWEETVATEPAVTALPTTEPAQRVPVGTVYVVGTEGAGATCQSAANDGSAGMGWLAEGAAVDVTGEQIGDWLPVDCNGVPGFLSSTFVTWDAAIVALPVEPAAGELAAVEPVPIEPPLAEPALEPALDANPTPVSNRGRRGGGGDGGGGGQAIADFALQFNGYPYVWAGADPSTGFDCSGFTMYVIQQTLGRDITHDMFAQYDMGTPVARDDLRPGDLVFFQNTFRPGMSHNGIYIGNGQMVHAENESTGVKISDINADYYASRWYGAVRFG